MMEFKLRTTKALRCEENGNRCEIFGGIGSALVGGALGLLGQGGKESRQQTVTPTWSAEQMPYLFGDQVTLPETPLFRADALNYGRGLMGGYNPAYGPQQPMGFGDFLGGVRGLSGAQGTTDPYYLDPEARSRVGGVRGLLGYDQGVMPPLFTNSPFLGVNVDDPSRLQLPPGVTRDQMASNGANGRPEQAAPVGPTQGQIVRAPREGLDWGVRVSGGGLLSMPEAMPLVRAGLLSIDQNSDISPTQAYVLQASEDAMGYG